MEKPNGYARMGRIIESALALFMCFVAFTLLVKFVDARPIGPNGSVVGFAAVNAAVRDFFGTSDTWYTITECIGYVAIAVAAAFACMGAVQAIGGRSLRKVDPRIYALGVVYVLVIVFYVFFELVVVNYRPILVDGILEASYPSSHSMVAMTVFGTAAILSEYYIKRKGARRAVTFLCGLCAGVVVFGRLASGVHWLTDVIGGLLLSAFFIDTFKNVCAYIDGET